MHCRIKSASVDNGRLQTIENCDMVYRVPGDGSIVGSKEMVRK